MTSVTAVVIVPNVALVLERAVCRTKSAGVDMSSALHAQKFGAVVAKLRTRFCAVQVKTMEPKVLPPVCVPTVVLVVPVVVGEEPPAT